MAEDFELAFFSALRSLRHLYFLLEKQDVELHSSCDDCNEIRNFMNAPRYRGVGVEADDWQGAFSGALTTLKHLYFRLEEARSDLHSPRCFGCNEIRDFLNTPGYLGNREDPIEVEIHRPLTEYDNSYEKAAIAEKPLRERLGISEGALGVS